MLLDMPTIENYLTAAPTLYPSAAPSPLKMGINSSAAGPAALLPSTLTATPVKSNPIASPATAPSKANTRLPWT